MCQPGRGEVADPPEWCCGQLLTDAIDTHEQALVVLISGVALPGMDVVPLPNPGSVALQTVAALGEIQVLNVRCVGFAVQADDLAIELESLSALQESECGAQCAQGVDEQAKNMRV